MIPLSIALTLLGISILVLAGLRARSADPVPWTIPYRVPIPARPAARIVLSKLAWEHGPDRCALFTIG